MARDADILIYNSAIESALDSLEQLVDKSPLQHRLQPGELLLVVRPGLLLPVEQDAVQLHPRSPSTRRPIWWCPSWTRCRRAPRRT